MTANATATVRLRVADGHTVTHSETGRHADSRLLRTGTAFRARPEIAARLVELGAATPAPGWWQ